MHFYTDGARIYEYDIFSKPPNPPRLDIVDSKSYLFLNFQGILVEVEYCPCVVANNCWGILQEFMQGFLGSCVPNTAPTQIINKGSETWSPVDTIQQYLTHFNIFRKTAGVR